MKKLSILIFFLPLFCLSQFKAPDRISNSYVNDYDGILSKEQILNLNNRIKILKDSTKSELTVVILSDLQGYEIDQASLEIGRKWGVGKKETNNGIVYLLSPKNRKGRIEVGYGLEGDLPDVLTKHIQDAAKPYYKEKDYYNGINIIIKSLSTELWKASPEQKKLLKEAKDKEYKEDITNLINVLIFLLILSIIGAIIYYVYRLYSHLNKLKKDKLFKESLEKDNKSELETFFKNKHLYLKTTSDKFFKLSLELSEHEDIENFRIKFLRIKGDINLLVIPSENYLDFKNKLFNKTSSIDSIFTTMQDKIKNYEYKNNFVINFKKNLKETREKVIAELQFTPYKDINDSMYKTIISGAMKNILLYDSCVILSELYSKILNYRKDLDNEKEKVKLRKIKEEKQEKEYNNRIYYQSVNNDSQSNDSSNDSFSFGVGSFGGGGSTSDW